MNGGGEMGPSKEWNLAKTLLEHHSLLNNYACLILNRPINLPPLVAQQLWQNAKLRCTVDGGTNRWRHFLISHCKGMQMKPPDFITGDFDSIHQDSWKFFNSSQTQKVHTPSQDATDFTKAVRVIQPHMQKNEDIIVFQETSGRLDHIIANINTLHQLQGHSLNVFLLGGNSITWLLRPGKHFINIPKKLLDEQRWCALIPIGERATVTTQGLKWDLSNDVLEFGGMVSTSNTYAGGECIEIITSANLIWTMGLYADRDD